MDDSPVVQFVEQREEHLGDCTIAAFAMCLGLTYSQALVTIASVAPRVLEEGADWRELKVAARKHGVVLVQKKGFDLDDLDEGGGILGVKFPERVEHGVEHAVYFKRGLIFDGRTKCVWDADVYIHVHKLRVLTMLVRTS